MDKTHDKFQHDRAEQIFAEAIRISCPAERSEHLRENCRDDGELRRIVEGLIEANENPDSFLNDPAGLIDETVDSEAFSAGAGTVIGRYKLLQEIGEGAFGVVYMAEQEKPIRRKVAVKVIKPGMDSRAVTARFEAERQALAMMDHPNIARVFDGGTTENQRPFFVMELVKGVPITTYCDDNNLCTRERLGLFLEVCGAVRHAHQKGIIHRDLKPGNVLVTLHDGKPVVKVIDFGIAKAINQQLTEKTLFTAFGQMVGTPQYMSPEQAEMSGLDVDTRSDIYSLGVLLYELLTGTTPLTSDQLYSASYAEMQRLIKEEGLPKPSTRLSTSRNELTHIADHRSVSPERLHREVKGDLDWIVMKALEKDRNRRYDTAASFMADIQRLLQHEPVEARPPSSVYRLRKFVGRNRTVVAAAAIVTFALCTAIAGLAIGLQRANDVLSRLRDTAIRESIVAALSGDERRANAALQAADEAGVKPGDLALIRGILALNRGDYDRAISLAEQSKKDSSIQGPDFVGALAIRTTAEFWSSKLEQAEINGQKLQSAVATNSLERLLQAYATVAHHPSKALEILDADQDIARSPLGVFIRGQAGVLIATDQHDYEKLLRAIQDLEFSRYLFGDSPSTVGWLLQGYGVGVEFAADGERKVQAGEYKQKGSELKNLFSGGTPFSWGLWVFSRAIDDFEGMKRAGRDVPFYLAADCLSRAAGSEALARFDELSPGEDNTKLRRLARAHLRLGAGHSKAELRDSVEDLIHDPSPLIRRHALSVLCLVCDSNEIHQLAQMKLSDSMNKFDDVWLGEACCRFFAGQLSEQQLKHRAEDHRYSQGNVHFTIAMMRLAQHDRDGALASFRNCADAKTYGSIDYELAQGYLHRLNENESWLPWSVGQGTQMTEE